MIFTSESDRLYIENLEKQLEAAHKDYEELRSNRWAAFTDEELDGIDRSFGVTDNEGMLWPSQSELWDEIAKELERRKANQIQG